MGNVYRYAESDDGKLINIDSFSFIIHGSKALTKLAQFEKEGMPVGKIAAHFCGYCGCYVALNDSVCNCGNFVYQGWNYDEGDSRRWVEPKLWSEGD